jgi:hypothetical protein
MPRQLLILAASLLVALLLPVRMVAAQTEALDEAVVAVANQGDAARAEAASKALRQVLVKMSGDRRGVDGHPELLKDALSRVQQYQYRDGESGQQLLWAKFDAGSIRELLTSAGVPLWSGERSSLLLWQVTEQGGNATIATASQTDALAGALRAAASQRGVPLVLPMLDAAAPAVTADDIRHADAGRLRAASTPYSAGEIAAAVVSQGQDGLWRGRFTLLRGEHGQTWVAQGETAEVVAAQGIDQIVDALASPVAAASTGTTSAVEVRVVGLTTLQQMAQVESYLRTLPGMSRVDLGRLEPAQVSYRMLATGGSQGAAAAIGAGQVLLPAGADMTYRLNPALPPPAPAGDVTSPPDSAEAAVGATIAEPPAPAPDSAPDEIIEAPPAD